MFENFWTLPVVCTEDVVWFKGDAVKGDWRKSHNRELYYTFSSAFIVGMKKGEGWDGLGMWCACGRREIRRGFW